MADDQLESVKVKVAGDKTQRLFSLRAFYETEFEFMSFHIDLNYGLESFIPDFDVV